MTDNIVPLPVAQTPSDAPSNFLVTHNAPLDAMLAVEEWARELQRSGTLAPWEFYRIMQLRDALEHLNGPLDPIAKQATGED